MSPTLEMVHELENWKLFFREVKRILKLGGKVCVVDNGVIGVKK
jgi:ubiquinone/menaquinone biosynthesis C-methylase UbiE